MKPTFTYIEIEESTGLARGSLVIWIEREWIAPADPESQRLDEEDVARIRLIRELREDFGANDEAIPLILHLLDQICYLRSELARIGDRESG